LKWTHRTELKLGQENKNVQLQLEQNETRGQFLWKDMGKD